MDFSINLYLIKGFMFGFEMIELEDDEKYIVVDLGIVRVYMEY